MHFEVGGAAYPWRLAGLVLAGLLLLAPQGSTVERAAPPEAPAGSPTVGTEAAPPQARVADPSPDPLEAWSRPGELQVRAERAHLAALLVGVPSFDAPARALLLDSTAGGRVERAKAAAEVAPGLPLAQFGLASALLSERYDVTGAAAATVRGLAALPRHREARLWFEATGALVARNALFFGAFAFLTGLAALHVRAASHDLGDRIARALPLFARAGLLGVLLLLPAILGHGLLGVAVTLFAVSRAYGRPAERRAAAVAAAVLLLGLEAGPFAAARAVLALAPDPVVAAVERLEQGVASPADLAPLEHMATSDRLAARGLALKARRRGHLDEAAQRYQALLATGSGDATLMNNAGNVQMALGDVEHAVGLYEVAVSLEPSAVVLYNLSYGYGHAIRPHAQEETLRRLQTLDPALDFRLTQLQSTVPGGFTLDLPIPLELLRARAERGDAVPAMAFELRRALAPSALGNEPLTAAGAFGVAAILAQILRFRRSDACHRCGVRLCPRCDGPSPLRDRCATCHRLLQRPETADPERRAKRLAELEQRAQRLSRLRLLASLVFPGAAGLLVRRPWLGLAGALSFANAIACFAWQDVGIPDPLAAGGAGALAFGLLGILATVLYGATSLLALKPRPEPKA